MKKKIMFFCFLFFLNWLRTNFLMKPSSDPRLTWWTGNSVTFWKWFHVYRKDNLVGCKNLEIAVDQCLINPICHLETLISGKALTLPEPPFFHPWAYLYGQIAVIHCVPLFSFFRFCCVWSASVNIASVDTQRNQ